MQKLLLAEDIFDALEDGKETTIRQGRRDISLGELLFVSVEEEREEIVDVIMVSYCQLQNVALTDLQNDGFVDHADMLVQMKRFYPEIEEGSEVTVINFRRV